MTTDPQVLDGTITIPDPVTVADLPGNDWWATGALAAIETLANTGRYFTSTDVTNLGVAEPDHPNHWGGVFAKAKALGLIVKVGHGTSSRTGRNGGSVSIWTGTTS